MLPVLISIKTRLKGVYFKSADSENDPKEPKETPRIPKKTQGHPPVNNHLPFTARLSY